MLTKTPASADVLPQPTTLPLEGTVERWVDWRKRLATVAMSLVVAWHSLAMLVAPAPADSTLVHSLRSMLQPYISLLRLDTGWGFFAPVGKHAQFRYVIRDAAGHDHMFVPTEEPAGSIFRYVWWREFKYLYDGIMDAPETRAGVAGTMLCREHVSLDPLFVTLLQVQEENFWPEDLLAGKHPLDPDYVTVNTLTRVPCRSSPVLPRPLLIRPRRPS
jgi:hypothetical protein